MVAPIALCLLLSLNTSIRNKAIRCTDPLASVETQALYRNLHTLASEHILFGHQDTLAYGLGWRGGPFDSDVFRVCGKFPAVFGWDLGHIGEPNNIDGVPFVRMRDWIIEAYRRGGVITVSWHARVPGTGQSSWTEESVVEKILPGGELHQAFVTKLEAVADFLDSLQDTRGGRIPVIFRPWHENHGSWFWWGAKHCSPAQYKELWYFTLRHLREKRGLHHLLTAYSPNDILQPEDYLKRYPGDKWIDIFGVDDYHRISDPERHKEALRIIENVVSMAQKHRKLPALTETGLECIPNPAWWTKVLLPLLQTNETTRQLSWVLVWRNGRPDHYYGPYPGQVSAENFKQFEQDPYTLFLEDLPRLYQSQ